MSSGQKNRGFTLIEVLIAPAVFSVMSVMAYGGLKSVLDARNGTERAAERLTELQMAFLLIQQDMQYMAPRGIRGEYGEQESALFAGSGADYQIAFTRGGRDNPRRPGRSGLYRVAYQWEEDELKRLVWPALDRIDNSTPTTMVLLRGVSDVAFSFLQGGWSATWPVPGADTGLDALPQAVEMVVVLEDWGTITRVFAMPY